MGVLCRITLATVKSRTPCRVIPEPENLRRVFGGDPVNEGRDQDGGDRDHEHSVDHPDAFEVHHNEDRKKRSGQTARAEPAVEQPLVRRCLRSCLLYTSDAADE